MSTVPESAEQLVHHLFPPQRPYDHDATVRTALMLHHLMRYLHQATGNDAGLPRPLTAYEVIGCLTTTADQLPQLLRQVGCRVVEFSEDPAFVNRQMNLSEVRAIAHLDALDRAARAAQMLNQAAVAADDLAAYLNAAHQLLGPVVP